MKAQDEMDKRISSEEATDAVAGKDTDEIDEGRAAAVTGAGGRSHPGRHPIA